MRIASCFGDTNMTSRTKAAFWLHQLQIAAVHYVNAKHEIQFSSRAEFKDVLVLSPELLDPLLWTNYYSPDRFSAPEARERWCLPDVNPLPSVIRRSRSCIRSRGLLHDESDGLIGFALAVVQKNLRCKLGRGAVAKQALAALQLSTIRQRVSQPSLPPYSETRAYFWIHLTHLALASLEARQWPKEKSTAGWEVMVQALTPAAFRALFGFTGEEWREHYSLGLWNSVGARMAFHAPDRKTLPTTFPKPTLANVQRARSKLAHGFGLVEEHRDLPSAEDLALISAVVLDEAELIGLEGPDGTIIRKDSHARTLLRLYRGISRGTLQCTGKGGGDSELALGIAASDGELPGCDVGWLTQTTFWTKQLVAAMEEAPSASFEELISANTHLAYEELPLVYFSLLVMA